MQYYFWLLALIILITINANHVYSLYSIKQSSSHAIKKLLHRAPLQYHFLNYVSVSFCEILMYIHVYMLVFMYFPTLYSFDFIRGLPGKNRINHISYFFHREAILKFSSFSISPILTKLFLPLPN